MIDVIVYTDNNSSQTIKIHMLIDALDFLACLKNKVCYKAWSDNIDITDVTKKCLKKYKKNKTF